MSYEMEWGIEFEGASESEKISESYSKTLQKSTESTYSKSLSSSITVDCKGDGSESVGVFQWVTETADG